MTFAAKPLSLLRVVAEHIGYVVIHIGQSIQFVAKSRIGWRDTLIQTASVGVDSLPMALLINFIAGSVLAIQTAERFAQTGADDYVGGVVALAIVREIAPIFAGLSVAARSGTAIAAEVANMKVNNQVAALQMMHVNPVRYLLVPRLLACLVSLPMITLLCEWVGILGGMVVVKQVASLPYIKFLDSIWVMLTPLDVRISLFKASVFGILLASICYTIGINTVGGARQVGLSTTRAAVWTAIAIIIADFVMSYIFINKHVQL